jgi:hypothetical protein
MTVTAPRDTTEAASAASFVSDARLIRLMEDYEAGLIAADQIAHGDDDPALADIIALGREAEAELDRLGWPLAGRTGKEEHLLRSLLMAF